MGKIKLCKPFSFEGKEYTEVELKHLDEMTVKDVIEVQKETAANASATLATVSSTAFIIGLLARAAEMPVEFFKLMPMQSMKEARMEIMKRFGSNEKKPHDGKLELEKPYTYKGKSYTVVEFPGASKLCGMDMMEAEDTIAEEGFVAPYPQGNYLYCCVLMARASGLPEEFFTGLPMNEATKIKNAVESKDFFE